MISILSYFLNTIVFILFFLITLPFASLMVLIYPKFRFIANVVLFHVFDFIVKPFELHFMNERCCKDNMYYYYYKTKRRWNYKPQKLHHLINLFPFILSPTYG